MNVLVVAFFISQKYITLNLKFNFTNYTYMLNQILLQPYNYFKNNISSSTPTGTLYEKVLLLALNHWLDIPSDKLSLIGEIFEMLVIVLTL